MGGKIIHLTDDSFGTDVLKTNGTILVGFWAEWCGPCRMITSALDETADGYQDKLTVIRLSIDQNPGIASRYGIRDIPTLLLFKNGGVAATRTGALSRGQLKEFLGANLAQENFMFGYPVTENWTSGVSHANLVLTSYQTYFIRLESCNFQRFPSYLECEVSRFLARHSIRLVVSVLRTLL